MVHYVRLHLIFGRSLCRTTRLASASSISFWWCRTYGILEAASGGTICGQSLFLTKLCQSYVVKLQSFLNVRTCHRKWGQCINLASLHVRFDPHGPFAWISTMQTNQSPLPPLPTCHGRTRTNVYSHVRTLVGPTDCETWKADYTTSVKKGDLWSYNPLASMFTSTLLHGFYT